MPTTLLQSRGILPVRRRRFLALSAAAMATPSVARQVMAFGAETRNFRIGDFTITVVSDGHLVIPTTVIAANLTGAAHEAAVAEVLGQMSDTFAPQTNHPVLQVGSDLILIDNGSGNKFQPSAGMLIGNLRANGIDPAAITKVVFTHAHPDHVWGTLTGDGALAFPNAAYYVGAKEYDFWMGDDIFTILPVDFHPFAQGAQRDLGAVQERLTMVSDGDAIASGVSVIETPGHTPGHISIFVDAGDGLIITGDAASHPVMSVEHPDWVFGFDFDSETAVASRKALVARAAADGNRILGYHFPYPGVGVVETKGGGFTFLAED